MAIIVRMIQNMAKTWQRRSKTWPKHDQEGPKHGQMVSRRFVRKTSCQHDILSGWPDRLGRFVRTALDVLSGWIHVRRFVRKTFCQQSKKSKKVPKVKKVQ